MGITRIYEDVFSNNSTIETLTIPDEVITIYPCFRKMSRLKSIRLSSSLQTLGSNCFKGSMALEAVFLRSYAPPSYSDNVEDWAKWGADNLTIYVPDGFVDHYKQASGWSKYASRIQAYVYEDLEKPDYYMSSDYSQDRVVTTLQTATEGNGINLVLMGDAYSDRQIADGTYGAAMQKMADAFFSEEPYTTYKNMFNVYAVNVVSFTEGYEHGGQALGTYFGDGTLVGGDDSRCIAYAQTVIPSSQMDNTLIVVAMNRDYYAGTCWMYYPGDGDYGKGLAIAYFPTSSDMETFEGLVRHEAGGHGFSKLADEYAYDRTISEAEKTSMENYFRNGWYKNIDFTNDPEQVKWARFLKDSRYANDGLGVFEGGATYAKGVWRPTENSIMRYNTGGFNAPSRESIWYRIHRLAYGESWQYDFEAFVAYDAKNRQVAGNAGVCNRNYVERRREPTHPPVVVSHRWNDPAKRPPLSSCNQ